LKNRIISIVSQTETMLKTYFVLVVSVSLFAFYACRKDHSSNENSQRLKEEVYRWGDSISYSFFFYDDQGRLIAERDSVFSGILRLNKSLLEYDVQGRLSKVSYSTSDPYIQSLSYSFVYDNNNQIIRKIELASDGSVRRTANTYNYDTQGRLTTDSVYDYWSESVYSWTVFTYGANDNVISWENNNKQGGAQSIKSISVSYDNKLNPYRSLGKVAYFIMNKYYDQFYLTRNNPTQIKYDDLNYGNTTVDYKYEYSENGLPKKIKIVTTYGQTEAYNDFVEFYYE
jgi:hypothetical protein